MTRGEDATVLLRGELMRLKRANAFEILGVPLSAGTEDVRQAFLAATKRRHPNRFAREAPEIRHLANELFLVIRAAYDQLLDDTRRAALREKLQGAPSPAQIPALAAPTSPRGSSQLPALPVPPAAQRGSIPSAQRPTVPAVPQARAAGTQKPFPDARPIKPISIGQPADVNALVEEAKGREKRYALARTMLQEGRYREAREALLRLATEEPGTRKFRVTLHLAWGLEHRHEGRADDAARELERALALEPDNAEAAEALRKLEADRKRGLFTKTSGR